MVPVYLEAVEEDGNYDVEQQDALQRLRKAAPTIVQGGGGGGRRCERTITFGVVHGPRATKTCQKHLCYNVAWLVPRPVRYYDSVPNTDILVPHIAADSSSARQTHYSKLSSPYRAPLWGVTIAGRRCQHSKTKSTGWSSINHHAAIAATATLLGCYNRCVLLIQHS